MVLDHEGIELIVGYSRIRDPWHRVQEARLVSDRRRSRRPGHVMVLELQPGTLPPKPGSLAPVPRWDQALQGVRFAEIARLTASNEEIERALGRLAGERWMPARDISLTGDARQFRTRRRPLAVGAIALLALALSPLSITCSVA